jgi:hypothetical protein
MTRTRDAAFSALAGLNPLAPPTGMERDPAMAGAGEIATDARLARIMATPRPTVATGAPGTQVRHTTDLIARRRSRYGPLGLVASASIAALAVFLWVSPSAGAPASQADGGRSPIARTHLSTPASSASPLALSADPFDTVQ